MQCEKCPANYQQQCPESYEEDAYCKCGILDEERTERKNGALGCNLRPKTIQNRLKQEKKKV